MCNYKKSDPQPKTIPYPRVQFESKCGLKVVLKEKYGQVELPVGCNMDNI